MSSTRWACVLFLLAFGFYLHGLCPSVSVGDSGEFITAAATLGIPHPPAFPAYVILTRAVSSLIPWANAGYRVNAVSTLEGSLCVILIFLSLKQTGLGSPAALFAALLYLFSKAPTVSARGAEVFSLHAVFVAALLWTVTLRRWRLLAFLMALAFANHQTVLFLVPGIAAYWIISESWPKIREWIDMGVCFVAGLTLYGFVWLRALRQPFLNVGNGNTLERFWRIVTRADYGSLTLALGDAPARSMEMAWRHLERFGLGLNDQCGFACIALAAAGIFLWWRRDRARTWLLGVSFLMLGPFFFWFGNLPFNAQSSGLLGRFYVAPLICLAFMSAMSVERMTPYLRGAVWGLLLLPCALGWRNAQATQGRYEFRAYAYGRNNLRTLPPRAIFVMDGGDDTFYTLAYLTQVEHRRPDIEMFDRGGIVFAHPYGDDFRTLSSDQKDARRRHVETVLASGSRPLCFSTMNPNVLPGITLNQNGFLSSPAFAKDSPVAQSVWRFYDLRSIAPWMASSLEPVSDYRLRALIPFYSYQCAIQSTRSGAWLEGDQFLHSAGQVGSDVFWLQPNLIYTLQQWAYQSAQKNDAPRARRYYMHLLAIDPHDAETWTNLGALEDRQNNLAQAMEDYHRALNSAPNSVQAHFNLAVCFWKQRRWTDAQAELTRVLELDPNYPNAGMYLSRLHALQRVP